MAQEVQQMVQIFQHPDSQTNKKLRTKKQLYLQKFQLFTLILQKKGQQNFSYIVNNIKIKQYGVAADIVKDPKQRSFTYIISGFVMIYVQRPEDLNSPPVLYKKMGPNQHFGEKLVYNVNQRLHSVKSVLKTFVFQLDLQTFYKTFSGHFKYQQLAEKVQFLNNIWVFKEINVSQIQRILLVSKPYKYTKNTILFKYGDKPEAVYVIIQGQLTLFKKDQKNSNKYFPFMLLTTGQVCCCEQVLQKTEMRCGGIITSSFAVLLKITSGLFLDVFSGKVDNETINSRNQIRQKLLSVKQKKSINLSLKKLNESRRLSQIQIKTSKNNKHRYITQITPTKMEPIFKINDYHISWENKMKNKALRQISLREKTKNEQIRSSSIRISTITNNSFTNEKQLLLDYLIRKQRKSRRAQQWQYEFQHQIFHQVKELIVQKSSAVKAQKRKMKTSRNRNASSMSSFI